MTLSKIRGFQTPPDDVIFHRTPLFSFPKINFGKIVFMVKLKNHDLAMNIFQNKDQSNCC